MGSRTLRAAIALCGVVAGLSSLPASADILIESYRIERPADADRILGALRDELSKAGVKVTPAEVIAAAGDQLPLPGVADPKLGANYPMELSSQVELGTKQAFRGEYDAGVTTLEGVLTGARDNAALVVADPASPTWLTKAYAALAFAYLRKHNRDAATEVIKEQVRSFPDVPIGRMVGPDVAELAESSHKTLKAMPHGSLRIVASRPDVQIYVNESLRGSGRAYLTLIPGKYRLLFTRLGVSRRRPVLVVPDQDADLYIDWDADAAFHASLSWVGMLWSHDQADRTDAAVTRYARGARHHDILVVSVVVRSHGRFLVGEVFEKSTGVMVRRKAIAIDGAGPSPDSESCPRALAHYLVRGDASSCLMDLPPETAEAPRVARSERDPYLAPGIVAGVGVAALIAGVTMLTTLPDPGNTPLPKYHAVPGISVVVGGGLAIGLAAYLTLRSSRDLEDWRGAVRRSRAPMYAAAATAVASFVAGGYLLHLDGRPTCGLILPHCPFVYHTKWEGWAMIGTGVAASGLGVYWQLGMPRERQSSSVGMIPTGAGVLASFQGRF